MLGSGDFATLSMSVANVNRAIMLEKQVQRPINRVSPITCGTRRLGLDISSLIWITDYALAQNRHVSWGTENIPPSVPPNAYMALEMPKSQATLWFHPLSPYPMLTRKEAGFVCSCIPTQVNNTTRKPPMLI